MSPVIVGWCFSVRCNESLTEERINVVAAAYAELQVALAVGDDQLRPELPSNTNEDLVSLAHACFQSDPLSRPSFSHLVTQLSSICNKIDKQVPQSQVQASILTRFMKSRPFS